MVNMVFSREDVCTSSCWGRRDCQIVVATSLCVQPCGKADGAGLYIKLLSYTFTSNPEHIKNTSRTYHISSWPTFMSETPLRSDTCETRCLMTTGLMGSFTEIHTVTLQNMIPPLDSSDKTDQELGDREKQRLGSYFRRGVIFAVG